MYLNSGFNWVVHGLTVLTVVEIGTAQAHLGYVGWCHSLWRWPYFPCYAKGVQLLRQTPFVANQSTSWQSESKLLSLPALPTCHVSQSPNSCWKPILHWAPPPCCGDGCDWGSHTCSLKLHLTLKIHYDKSNTLLNGTTKLLDLITWNASSKKQEFFSYIWYLTPYFEWSPKNPACRICLSHFHISWAEFCPSLGQPSKQQGVQMKIFSQT